MKPEAMLVVVEDQLMLSTSDGTKAVKGGEVLSRRGNNYDDWGDEEEDF